jgi:hypothetical protein
MYAINMFFVIIFIANQMFPIAPLPNPSDTARFLAKYRGAKTRDDGRIDQDQKPTIGIYQF